MRRRNTYLIAATLAFFLAGGLYLLQQADDDQGRLTVTFEQILKGFSPDAVTRLTFYREGAPKQKTELVRTGPDGHWKVAGRQGAPANLPRVEALLTRMQLLLGEPRYEDDPELSRLLGLNPEKAFHVEVYTKEPDRPTWHILLGKPGGVKFTVFLKKQGDNRIFLANMLLYPSFGIEAEDLEKPTPAGFWLDLEGYDIPAEQIVQARVKWHDGRHLTLTRQGERNNPDTPEHSGKRHGWEAKVTGLWQSGAGTWDQDTLGSYVDNLRIVLFNDVAGPIGSSDFGLDAPVLKIDLQRQDGDITTLKVGTSVDTGERPKHYAQIKGETFVYLLSDYLFQKIARGPEAGP